MSYEAEGIDLAAMDDDPIVQFQSWFVDAQESVDPEPYAMVLSTVDASGQPRGRMVLLRGVTTAGFVFYTDYTSSKAQEIEHSGRAALTFHWHSLHRQVRVAGVVSQVAPEVSDAYFAGRPRGSQLGAWASDQSAELASRADLVSRLDEVTARFEGSEVSRPPDWGGYQLRPLELEFWQGQPSRLHDRLRYARSSEDSDWDRSLLNP